MAQSLEEWRVSRLRHALAVLGVAAVAWLLPGEALASEPPSKPPDTRAKPPRKRPAKLMNPEPPRTDFPETDMKKVRPLLDKARALMKREKLDEAFELTQRCIDLAPLCAECYLWDGTVLELLGDDDMAARQYGRFLKLSLEDSPEEPRVREWIRQRTEARDD